MNPSKIPYLYKKCNPHVDLAHDTDDTALLVCSRYAISAIAKAPTPPAVSSSEASLEEIIY